MPTDPAQRDWTSGPAKWAAVLVLGGASIAGMGWSIFGREPRRAIGRDSASFVTAAEPARTGRTPPAAPRPLDPTPPLTPDTPALAPKPAAGTTAAPSPSKSKKPPAPARLINLNTAAAAELELLPGIGPALAARIIEDRTKNGLYRRVEDIDRVKGIGPRLLEKIKPMATVE